MQLILNGDTRPVLFFVTSSTDHLAGVMGASPAVTVSKNGAAFAAPAGSVAEVGDGWYKLTPSGADVTTNGILLLHATATGADPTDVKCQVVAFNPYDAAALGLSDIAEVAGFGAPPSAAAVATAVLTTPLTKAFANPSTPSTWTLSSLLFSKWRWMFSRAVSGTTESIYDVDNTTVVHTVMLNDGTNPTSAKQAS